MATLNLQDYALNDLGGVTKPIIPSTGEGPQSYLNGRENYVPTAPFENTQPSRPATPTVGSVMGTKPTADSLMQQALAIQAQIPTATGYTKKFNAPTAETGDAEYKDTNLTAAQERAIQRAQMKLFQKEIDATNQIYDEMIRQERIAGQGRLGSQAAIGARAGILGSDFQGAAEEDVRKDTSAIIGGVQAERSAKIAAIMGKGRQAAVDEIAAKNKANKEGAEAKIKFMAEKQDRKNRNLNKLAASLIEQGINPDELSKEELDAIVTSYGTTEADIRAEYTSQKVAADAEAAKNAPKPMNISEGGALVDPVTGEVLYKNPKTYAPKDSTTRTADYNKTLLGGGWSGEQIDALESGVEAYGLQEVIAQEKANGATPAQIKALEQAYKVPEEDKEINLSRENLATFYGISDDDTQSSILGFEYGQTGKEKLNELEKMINQYRAIGYTDAQILKEMQ